MRLGDVLEGEEWRALLALDPSLADMDFSLVPEIPGADPFIDALVRTSGTQDDRRPTGLRITAFGLAHGLPDILNTLVHEVGHIQQDKEGWAPGAYYVAPGETATRVSNHSADAELFLQDGTDGNLSIAIRRPGDRKAFNADDRANVVEAVFKRDYLDAHPEMLPHILRDIAEFVATGEYHDTAGAMAYNYSGSEAFKARARDRIHEDAIARGDWRTAQRMVDEQAEAKMDAVLSGPDGSPLRLFRGTTLARMFRKFTKQPFNVNADLVGGYYFSPDRTPKEVVVPHGFENNIKSADLATFDDSGELIPLSRRFDRSKSDMHFASDASLALADPNLVAAALCALRVKNDDGSFSYSTRLADLLRYTRIANADPTYTFWQKKTDFAKRMAAAKAIARK